MSIEHSNKKMTFKQLGNIIEDDQDAKIIKISDVELEGNQADAISFSKAVRGHDSLEEFLLTNITFSDKEVTLDAAISIMLLTVSNLKVLKLDNCPMATSTLKSIGYCLSLKKLLVPSNGLVDVDAGTIALALAANSSIEEVDLSNNNLSDKGCIAISTALEKNTTVQVIKMDGNGNISDEQLVKLHERVGGLALAA
jgi:Leucine-rich repeat (LRR) protein